WCDDYLGAECLEQPDFFLRHFVGHRENASVTPQCGRYREAHTGVTAGAFDYRPARSQLAFFFSTLDDREPDAILYRAARIEEFRFPINRRPDSARYVVQPDERRPPNRLQNAVVRLPVPFVLHQRVLRLVVALCAGFVAGVAAAALTASALAVSVDLILLVLESRLMIESPASGGASGCLQT